MLHKTVIYLTKSRPILLSLNKRIGPAERTTRSNRLVRSFSKCSTNFNRISRSSDKYDKDGEHTFIDQPPSNDQTSHKSNEHFLNDSLVYSHFSSTTDNNHLDPDKNRSTSELSGELVGRFDIQTDDQRNELTVYGDDDDHSVLNPNSTRMEREYIRTIRPELPPTFNLATYANQLDIIRQLVKLNVKLYEIEKNRDLTKYLISLDFDRDVIPYLNFLIRCGFRRRDLGDFLTSNFQILKQNLENLEKRYAYYLKMGFTKKEVLEMMIHYPRFISHPIDQVDAKLGYIEKYLKIKPGYVRKMLFNCSKILREDKLRIVLEVRGRSLNFRLMLYAIH